VVTPRSNRLGAAAAVFVLSGLFAFPVAGLLAQNTQGAIDRGVYTQAQAERGKASYATHCAECHGPDLEGTSFGDGTPALKRDDFMAGKSLKEVLDKVKRAMPFNAPGSLSNAVYLDVLAFVLRENGYPAGTQELGTDAEAMKEKLKGKS